MPDSRSSRASWTPPWALAGCAKKGSVSLLPQAHGIVLANSLGSRGAMLSWRRRTRLRPGHDLAFLMRGLRSAAHERDPVTVLRTHRGQSGTPGLWIWTLTRQLRHPGVETAEEPNRALTATTADSLVDDIVAMLVASHSDIRKTSPAPTMEASGSPPSSSASITAPATVPGKSSPRWCGPAAPGRTAPRTTSAFSTTPRGRMAPPP